MTKTGQLLLALAASLGPVAVIGIGPAFDVLARNEVFFGDKIAPATPFIVAALIVWLLASALWFFDRDRTLRAILLTYLALAPGWLVYRGLAEFMGAPSLIAFVAIALVCLLLGIVASRYPMQRFAAPAAIIGVALAAVPLLNSFGWLFQAAPSANAAPQKKSTAGGGPNVYHVVFDAFQSNFFEQKAGPELARELAGFTYYKNATTPYGRTEMALASTFSGELLGEDQSPISFIWSAWYDPQHALLKRVAEKGYLTEGHVFKVYAKSKDVPFDTMEFHRDLGSEVQEGQGWAFASFWAYALLPKQVNRVLLSRDALRNFADDNMLEREAPLLSRQACRDFLDNEATKPATGRYVVLHLILPHRPYIFDDGCNYEGKKGTSIDRQSGCAMTLMVEIVRRLKELGRFDNSLIIFHGDHGDGHWFVDGKLVRINDIMGVDHNRGRSRPLLLVKAPNAPSNQPMAVSEAPATLVDIAPTVSEALGLGAWKSFAGDSLLDRQVPDRPERFFRMYNKDPKFVTDGFFQQFVQRGDGSFDFDQKVPVKKETLNYFLKTKVTEAQIQ